MMDAIFPRVYKMFKFTVELKNSISNTKQRGKLATNLSSKTQPGYLLV
jgi:hypothetical protein